jgi:hypothetical protein
MTFKAVRPGLYPQDRGSEQINDRGPILKLLQTEIEMKWWQWRRKSAHKMVGIDHNKASIEYRELFSFTKAGARRQ